MMPFTARPTMLGLALLVLVPLAGCLETTEPVPIIEARVAHAAPGLPTAEVRVNGVHTWNLMPDSSVFFPLNPGSHTYEFRAAGQSAEIQVNHDADINAIVLLNQEDATGFHYRLERRNTGVRLLVVNGDFAAPAPMTVELVAGGETIEGPATPGEHFLADFDASIPQDDLRIRVRPAGTDEFIELPQSNPFPLVSGTNGFLVVAPAADGESYVRILF